METITIIWAETDGRGELVARGSDGRIVATVAHEEPITAGTDADTVVGEFANAGHDWACDAQIDHDGEFVHVSSR